MTQPENQANIQPDFQPETYLYTPTDPDNPFPHIEFIREDLAQKLVARGKVESKLMRWRFNERVLCPWFTAVFVAAFCAHFTHIKASLVLTISAVIFLPLWASIFFWMNVKVLRIENAFKDKQFDLVSELLPDAFRMNRRFYPLPFLGADRLYHVLLQMLMYEGRYPEFEALMLFRWGGAIEPQNLDEVPHEFLIANNLAIAYMRQKRFVRAEQLFENLINRGLTEQNKSIVLINYAICLLSNRKYSALKNVLAEAFALLGNDHQSDKFRRLTQLSASYSLRKGELEDAQTYVDTAIELATLQKESPVTFANCEIVIAKIREKQMRFEESKLHFKNAFDLIESADNPPYLSLATWYSQYAMMLAESGAMGESLIAKMKARQVFDFYFERETRATTLLEARLNDLSELFEGSELVTSAERIKYIDRIKVFPSPA